MKFIIVLLLLGAMLGSSIYEHNLELEVEKPKFTAELMNLSEHYGEEYDQANSSLVAVIDKGLEFAFLVSSEVIGYGIDKGYENPEMNFKALIYLIIFSFFIPALFPLIMGVIGIFYAIVAMVEYVKTKRGIKK